MIMLGAYGKCICMQLNFGCAASLFRQEVTAAGDIRLQVHAADACEVELSTFCSGVRPDNDEALLCLEDYRHSDGFSADCKYVTNSLHLL